MEGVVVLAVGAGICVAGLALVSWLFGPGESTTEGSSAESDFDRRKSSHNNADTSAADSAQTQFDTDAGWHNNHHHDHSSPF